jgi:hypothetical protein
MRKKRRTLSASPERQENEIPRTSTGKFPNTKLRDVHRDWKCEGVVIERAEFGLRSV